MSGGEKEGILGTTCPDVIRGQYRTGEKSDQDLASVPVVAFRSILSPALKASYAKGRGRFVDVTAATGAYTPLEQTTTLAPYGVIPQAVADVCRLTFYCQFRDIHARTSGYRIIAQLIADTLPRRAAKG